VVVDIRMPPTFTDEGARAARELKRLHPDLGVLVLSQHIETTHAVSLVTLGGFGYLLKDRVLDVDEFLEAIQRVSAGGSALDPEVVKHLLAPPKRDDALALLSPREHEVLGLVAEGRSNKAIGERLVITPGAVQKHVSTIFNKLGLPAGEDDDRRILAVLAYVRPEL
jgi:DNA-binding NarL/FixJ family response regulator